MERKEEAPESGQMLAYTRKKVIFEAYAKKEDVEKMLGDEELLELHLFDNEKEYRSVASRSKRFKMGKIETVVQFCGDEDDENGSVYCEETLLDNENMNNGTEKSILKVLNHISYRENGMTVVDNYRLCMGGGKNG